MDLRHLRSDCLEPTVHGVSIKTTRITWTTINRHLQCLTRLAQYVPAQSCLYKILTAGDPHKRIRRCSSSRNFTKFRRSSTTHDWFCQTDSMSRPFGTLGVSLFCHRTALRLYGVSSRRCYVSAKQTSLLCSQLPQRYWDSASSRLWKNQSYIEIEPFLIFFIILTS